MATPLRWVLAGAVVAGVAVLSPGRTSAEEPVPAPGGVVSPLAAPFGEEISERRILQYHRALPAVGTAGPLDEIGIIEAKRIGFRTIIDLQPAPEASAAERRIAEFSHLRYFNIPVGGDAPTAEQVAQLAALLGDEGNLPALLHGRDVDQVGAMWALYRALLGVPPAIALLDGFTAGLGNSADAVRARLGLHSDSGRAGR